MPKNVGPNKRPFLPSWIQRHGLAHLPLYPLQPGRTKAGKLCIQLIKMATGGFKDLYKLINSTERSDFLCDVCGPI